MSFHQTFSLIILGSLVFWYPLGSTYAGNEREEILNSFLKSNPVVSAHSKRGKGRKKSLGLAKNSKRTNGMLHNSRNSSQSRSAVSMGAGQFKFESKNDIRHDISVQGDSEFNIGGISLGGSSGKGTGNNSSKSGLIGTGGGLGGGGGGSWLDNSDSNNSQQIGEGGNNQDSKSEEVEQLEKDLLYAYMTECSYGEIRCKKEFLDALNEAGWKKIDETNLPYSSIEYVAFKNEKTDELVIAFRGTDLKADSKSAIFESTQDISADFNPLGDNIILKAFAQELAKYNNNITFLGHSKGGGEALYAGYKTGAQVVTFNPRFRSKWSGDMYKSGQARGYYVKGEFLDHFRLKDEEEGLVPLESNYAPLRIFKKHFMESVIAGLKKEIEIQKKLLP